LPGRLFDILSISSRQRSESLHPSLTEAKGTKAQECVGDGTSASSVEQNCGPRHKNRLRAAQGGRAGQWPRSPFGQSLAAWSWRSCNASFCPRALRSRVRATRPARFASDLQLPPNPTACFNAFVPQYVTNAAGPF